MSSEDLSEDMYNIWKEDFDKMAKKKKAKVPFHIANDYKEYSYEDGGLTITFWSKDDVDAKL